MWNPDDMTEPALLPLDEVLAWEAVAVAWKLALVTLGLKSVGRQWAPRHNLAGQILFMSERTYPVHMPRPVAATVAKPIVTLVVLILVCQFRERELFAWRKGRFHCTLVMAAAISEPLTVLIVDGLFATRAAEEQARRCALDQADRLEGRSGVRVLGRGRNLVARLGGIAIVIDRDGLILSAADLILCVLRIVLSRQVTVFADKADRVHGTAGTPVARRFVNLNRVARGCARVLGSEGIEDVLLLGRFQATPVGRHGTGVALETVSVMSTWRPTSSHPWRSRASSDSDTRSSSRLRTALPLFFFFSALASKASAGPRLHFSHVLLSAGPAGHHGPPRSAWTESREWAWACRPCHPCRYDAVRGMSWDCSHSPAHPACPRRLIQTRPRSRQRGQMKPRTRRTGDAGLREFEAALAGQHEQPCQRSGSRPCGRLMRTRRPGRHGVAEVGDEGCGREE